MFQIQVHYPGGWGFMKVCPNPEFPTLAEARSMFRQHLGGTRDFRILDLETLKVHPVAEEPTSEKPRFRAANIPVRSTDWGAMGRV